MSYPKLKNFRINEKKRGELCYTLYEATEKNSENRVFLKLLNQDFNHDEKTVLNFLGSAQIVKRLNHPNISKIYDSGKDGAFYYIASEFIDSEPLSALILEEFSLSFEDLIQILTEIGVTLRYAHLHGLIHGFLNPQNIFITSDCHIKIDEFGFSWFIPAVFKSEERRALELAQYIAPEFYQAIEKVDGRADIYSLGMILVHLLTGSPAFSGKSVAEIQNQHLHATVPEVNLYDRDLPYELQELIDKTTAKFRDKRFQNLKAFLSLLNDLRPVKPGADDDERVTEKRDALSLSFDISESEKYFSDDSEAPPPGLLSGLLSNVNAFSRKLSSLFSAKRIVFASMTIFALLAVFLLAANKISNPFGNRQEDNTLLTTNQMEESQTEAPLRNEKDLEEPDVQENEASLPAENNGGSQPGNGNLPSDIAKDSPPARQVIQPEAPVKEAKEPVVEKPQPPQNTTMSLLVQAENEPVAADVFLGEQLVGKTGRDGELTLPDLDIGETYTVKVTKEGYQSVSRKISAAENGAPVTFDLKFDADRFGTLMLDAAPTADSILIDGVLQQGSLPMKIHLRGGEHQVRFVNTALNASHVQSVSLENGQVINVHHDFTKSEYGKVAVSLKNAAQYGFGFVFVDGKLWEGAHNTTPVELRLPVGPHTIAVKRDGYNSLPQDIIVNVEKDETKYVAFTFSKIE